MNPWQRNLMWCALAAIALGLAAVQVLTELTRPGRDEAMDHLRTRLAESARLDASQSERPITPNSVTKAGVTPRRSIEETREKALELMKAFYARMDWDIEENRRPFALLGNLLSGRRSLKELTQEDLDSLKKLIDANGDIWKELDDLDWDRLHEAMIEASTRSKAFENMWDLSAVSADLLMAQAILDARAGNADAVLRDLARYLSALEVSCPIPESVTCVMNLVSSELERGAASKEAEEVFLEELARSRRRELFRRQQEQFLALILKELDELPQPVIEQERNPIRKVLGLGYCTIGLPLLNYDMQNFAANAERILDASSLPYLEAEAALADVRADCDARLLGEFGRNLGADFLCQPERFAARAEQEARMDLMRLGILVERYQAEHGAYPLTLDALQDRFAGALPVDPFSGGSYGYASDGQSFRLFSVGHDGEIVWRGDEAQAQTGDQSNELQP
jgi:hypothetical protein